MKANLSISTLIVLRINYSLTLTLTSCSGIIPSDLTPLTTVLPLGSNVWLDLLGDSVTILLDKNTAQSHDNNYAVLP